MASSLILQMNVLLHEYITHYLFSHCQICLGLHMKKAALDNLYLHFGDIHSHFSKSGVDCWV